jgi:hypothetical protein
MPLSSGEGSGSSGGASGDDGEDPSEAEDQSDAGDRGDAGDQTSCDLLARCCEMFASDDPGLGKCRWVSLQHERVDLCASFLANYERIGLCTL